MKAKTIKKVLSEKIEDWASSITDKVVAEVVRKNTIVTGGSIASMLLKEPINDFDCYFATKDAAITVARYYVNQYIADVNPKIIPVLEVTDDRVKIVIQSKGVTAEKLKPYINVEKAEKTPDEEKKKYHPLFITSNAITLSDDIQIVIRFFGDPDEIHKNYDFVHCTSWWSSENNYLKLRPAAMEALLARELRYVGSRYPLCSIIRTRKFIKRNFTINAGQYLKMAMQLNELDLTDVEVLEDQLVGVDVTYFHLLIDALRDSNSDITSEYVATIVDKIF